jgi:hypothetical protein
MTGSGFQDYKVSDRERPYERAGFSRSAYGDGFQVFLPSDTKYRAAAWLLLPTL